MASLKAELARKNRAYNLSLENIKKSALDYASLEFKRKSYELAALFKVETLKMLSQYTFIRDELIIREELLQKATKYSVM